MGVAVAIDVGGTCVGVEVGRTGVVVPVYDVAGAVVGGTAVGVAGNFTDGHAIFVHARPAFRHIHWLQ